MKNQTSNFSKNMLLGMIGVLTIGGAIGVLATDVLTIDTEEFSAIQKIKTTFFVEKITPDSYIRTKIENGSGTMNVISCEGNNACERLSPNNSTRNHDASVIGGMKNRNAGKNSLLVGGTSGTLEGQNTIVAGAKGTHIAADNSALLGIGNSIVQVKNAAIVGVSSGSYSGDNIVVLGGKNQKIDANNVMAIGDEITIANQGVFAFNSTTKPLSSQKDHTFLIKAERGLVVNTDKPSENPFVQLTMGGPLRAGYEASSREKAGSLLSKTCKLPGGGSYSCICAYGAEGSATSLSRAVVCDSLCNMNGNNINCPSIIAQCGTRSVNYPTSTTAWPINSTYCASGTPIGQPQFPGIGETVTRECEGTAGSTSCVALRDPDLINGICGLEQNTCITGLPQDLPDTADLYKWRCTGLNGGTNEDCQINKPKNGVCGTGFNQCVTPPSASSTGSNHHPIVLGATWECEGTYGGQTTSCILCESPYIANGDQCADIIMDKNVGATVAGTGVASYGHVFQRGNNYGFVRANIDHRSGSNQQVNTTQYSYALPYYNSIFRFYGNTGRRVGSDDGGYYNGRQDWSSTHLYSSMGNYSLLTGNNRLRGGNAIYDWQRQGPCPDGFHVPTVGEWNSLYANRKNDNPFLTINDFREYYKLPMNTKISGNFNDHDTVYFSPACEEMYAQCMQLCINRPDHQNCKRFCDSQYDNCNTVAQFDPTGPDLGSLIIEELGIGDYWSSNSFGDAANYTTPLPPILGKASSFKIGDYKKTENIFGTTSISYYSQVANAETPRADGLAVRCFRDKEPSRKNQPCTAKPQNAQRNMVSSITQAWDANSAQWVPSTESHYSITGSREDCVFRCDRGYEWQNNACVPLGTQTLVACQGLPANAKWNTVDRVLSTMMVVGDYNEVPSTTECRYKCKLNHTWNGSECIPDFGTIRISAMFSPGDIVIMDRNLGATQAGTGNNPATFGKYFQRGNNYGYTYAELMSGISTYPYCNHTNCPKIDLNNGPFIFNHYGPPYQVLYSRQHPYSSGMWFPYDGQQGKTEAWTTNANLVSGLTAKLWGANTRSEASTSVFYTQPEDWEPPYDTLYYKVLTGINIYYNTVGNLSYPSYMPTAKTVQERRGPCPEGYYVPSRFDMKNLYALLNKYYSIEINGEPKSIGIGSSYDLKKALKIPNAGHFEANGSTTFIQQSFNKTWTSSPVNWNGDSHGFDRLGYAWTANWDNGPVYGNGYMIQNNALAVQVQALPIRCFQDPNYRNYE